MDRIVQFGLTFHNANCVRPLGYDVKIPILTLPPPAIDARHASGLWRFVMSLAKVNLFYAGTRV